MATIRMLPVNVLCAGRWESRQQWRDRMDVLEARDPFAELAELAELEGFAPDAERTGGGRSPRPWATPADFAPHAS